MFTKYPCRCQKSWNAEMIQKVPPTQPNPVQNPDRLRGGGGGGGRVSTTEAKGQSAVTDQCLAQLSWRGALFLL
jgi:hypothetical protein